MSRFERLVLHLSTLLVGGTGLVYAWMVYLVHPSDPYALVNHPWQPAVQHLHILVAPLLVFAVGLIWRQHIGEHWQRGVRKRRQSGLSLVLTLIPMVVSGYLIQTATEESWRHVWVVVHLAASALWLAGYLVHQLAPRWRRRRHRVAVPASAGSIAGRGPTSDGPPGEVSRFHSPAATGPTAEGGASRAAGAPPGDR